MPAILLSSEGRQLRLAARIERIRRERHPDPLSRLLDPEFTDALWEYRHSHIGNEIPGNPHEKQWEVLRSPARHRWLFWGNQVGKTTIGAVEVSLLALGRHPFHQLWQPGIVAWASALTWELWENVLLPELLTWLPRNQVIDAPVPYTKSTKRTIRVRADNGRTSRITGKAAEQGAARYQSSRLHVFWGDEEHPEAVYDEVQPRLVRYGGIGIHTMTPLKGLCLPAEVRATTERGMVPIDEVRIGDVVVGRQGRKYPVVGVHDEGVSDLVEIETRRGYRVRCTPNHPWLVADSRRSTRDPHARREPDPRTLRKVRAEELTDEHWLPLASGHRWMWPESALTADDGYFVGQMVGDGSWAPRGDRHASMKLTTADSETRDWLAGYLDARGVRVREYPKSGDTVSVEWCNLDFARLVEAWGVDRTQKTGTKEVPECVWRGSEAAVRAFLQGVFDADGFADRNRDRVGLSTISESAARGVMELLLRFGVRANLSEYHDGTAAHARQYRLEITAADARRFVQHVGFRLPRKQQAIRPARSMPRRELYDRVVAVRPVERPERTYCIMVDDPSHLFQAGGFFSGNTWVHRRIYEPVQKGEADPKTHYLSHAGLRDNPSVTPEQVRLITEELRHNPAMLAARLEGKFVRPQGVVLPFDGTKHFQTVDETTLTLMLARGRLYCGIDFGLWRFAFVVGLVDRAGRMWIVREIFSQKESLDERALKIDKMLSGLAAPSSTPIWGDCANPQDIVELNNALQRIKSPYRVTAVAAENKIRKVGVERVENLLNRLALLVVRGLGEDQTWMLGMNAGRPGTPVQGSRFVWEIGNWLYPKTEDGKIQKDDPDDASADGGDMMAALRYLVMSWWKGPKIDVPAEASAWSARVLEHEAEQTRLDTPPSTARARRIGRSFNIAGA